MPTKRPAPRPAPAAAGHGQSPLSGREIRQLFDGIRLMTTASTTTAAQLSDLTHQVSELTAAVKVLDSQQHDISRRVENVEDAQREKDALGVLRITNVSMVLVSGGISVVVALLTHFLLR